MDGEEEEEEEVGDFFRTLDMVWCGFKDKLCERKWEILWECNLLLVCVINALVPDSNTT